MTLIKKKYKIKNKKIFYTSKSNLFKKADIISFHVPLTTQTRNLFNKENIILTKKGVAVVNTARGEIINIKQIPDPKAPIKSAKIVIAQILMPPKAAAIATYL